ERDEDRRQHVGRRCDDLRRRTVSAGTGSRHLARAKRERGEGRESEPGGSRRKRAVGFEEERAVGFEVAQAVGFEGEKVVGFRKDAAGWALPKRNPAASPDNPTDFFRRTLRACHIEPYELATSSLRRARYHSSIRIRARATPIVSSSCRVSSTSAAG